MKLKKISLIVMLLTFAFLVSGCSTTDVSNETKESGSTTKQQIIDDSFDDGGSGSLLCTQEVNAEEGIAVELKYNIEYKRGNILSLRSISRVTSKDNAKLDIYEESYKKIASNYKTLSEYKTSVIRDSNSVTYDTTINYDKIDVEKLLEIEGEEDNIIVNGKAKLTLWLDLAEKVGVVCEEV